MSEPTYTVRFEAEGTKVVVSTTSQTPAEQSASFNVEVPRAGKRPAAFADVRRLAEAYSARRNDPESVRDLPGAAEMRKAVAEQYHQSQIGAIKNLARVFDTAAADLEAKGPPPAD